MNNGQTGPKTAEGKRKSSLNALKHGLTACSPQAFEAISEEMGISYPEILDKMRTQFWPRDPLEDVLVTRIARCVWRLSLSSSMETRQLERNASAGRPGTNYERIMRFERLVDIHLHRAIATLQKKREADNKNNSQNEMPPRSI